MGIVLGARIYLRMSVHTVSHGSISSSTTISVVDSVTFTTGERLEAGEEDEGRLKGNGGDGRLIYWPRKEDGAEVKSLTASTSKKVVA